MSDSFLKLRNYFSNTIYSQIFASIRTVAQVSLPQKLILTMQIQLVKHI